MYLNILKISLCMKNNNINNSKVSSLRIIFFELQQNIILIKNLRLYTLFSKIKLYHFC